MKFGSRSSIVPDRGQIVWLNLGSPQGHEQAGRRPALVLSSASYNDRIGLCICCPITTQSKGYPFEVALPPSSGVRGSVLADHVRSADWRFRGAKLVGRAPASVVESVLVTINAILRGS